MHFKKYCKQFCFRMSIVDIILKLCQFIFKGKNVDAKKYIRKAHRFPKYT